MDVFSQLDDLDLAHDYELPSREDIGVADDAFFRIRELEEQLNSCTLQKDELEQRATHLVEELEHLRGREKQHQERISQLEYELNEVRCGRLSRLTSLAEQTDSPASTVIPPPTQFRTKAMSCGQIMGLGYASRSLSQLPLSEVDLDRDPDQDDDVFASGGSRPGPAVSSSTLDTGFSELSPKDVPVAKLCELQEQKDKLTTVLIKEVIKCTEERVLANKSITEVNKKAEHFSEISSQCPLRTAHDTSLPPHGRGFCVELQHILDDQVWDFSNALLQDRETVTRLREELDFYEDFAGLFWSVVREWSDRCEGAKRVTMLGHMIHACVQCQVKNPLQVESMPVTDLAILEEHFHVLCKQLLVPLVLIYLRDAGLFSSQLVTYILEPVKTWQQVTRLLDLLPIFGPTGLDIFIRALRRSSQGHIADVIAKAHPGRFQETPVTPPPAPRRATLPAISMRSPRVENSIKLFPQQTIEGKSRKSFFRRPKWLFRSGKYQFISKQ